MSIAQQIARQFRELHFGPNLTAATLKDTLADISWQQATTQVYTLNTIAKLTFHINYYTSEVLKVLEGGPLLARDKYSYDLPPINGPEDWDKLCAKALADGAAFADKLAEIPDEQLFENFVDEKYGNYYRNIHGIIEHSNYHLGQIALIKKILIAQEGA